MIPNGNTDMSNALIFFSVGVLVVFVAAIIMAIILSGGAT